MNLRTNEKGYLPGNYVAGVDTLESQEWYFGKFARKEAERTLLSGLNNKGTFLVRDSENSPGDFAISVLTESVEDRTPVIKHYRVRHTRDRRVYVSPKALFHSIDLLITHYRHQADGLCCRLRKTCPRDKPLREPIDKWELDRSRIRQSKMLGKGNFGEVWYGHYLNGRNVVVEIGIKTLHADGMSSKAFLEEAAIMQQCRHLKLVQLYGVCSKAPILMIMEFMCNGSLLEYMRAGKGKSLTSAQLVHMAAQVADGMSYLESHHMIHRDLAARNVLVGENNVVKIADFGLARALDADIYNPKKGGKFPIKWTAPEAALRDTFSIKSDVWSYGILLYEIFSRGMNPYPGMTNHEVLQQVERGYRQPAPDFSKLPQQQEEEDSSRPHPIYEIMLKCWASEPDDRPTFSHLYHFFDDFTVSSEPSYAADNF